MSRFPEIPSDQWSQAQRAAAAAIASGPRGGISGPFLPLLYSPGLMGRVQQVGEYLRFEAALPAALRELAILVTARAWTAQFEWFSHRPLAIAAGLSEKVIDDIFAARRPAQMSDQEAAVYDLCDEIHRLRTVSDATFQSAQTLLGRALVMDVIGLCGYYTLLAMVLNVSEVPIPSSATPLPPLDARHPG